MDTANQTTIAIPATSASSVRSRSRKQQRRSLEERRRIVEESLVAGASVAQVAEAHGIRASQVFHWRKLYREGRLDSNDPSATKLVPVRLADTTVKEGIGGRSEQPQRALPGTLYLECSHARLRLEGHVDPISLRVVLEWLQR